MLTYQFRKIQSQNLDLSFENNIASIYNEITYTDKSGGEEMTKEVDVDDHEIIRLPNHESLSIYQNHLYLK